LRLLTSMLKAWLSFTVRRMALAWICRGKGPADGNFWEEELIKLVDIITVNADAMLLKIPSMRLDADQTNQSSISPSKSISSSFGSLGSCAS
jgi:hypothetical protein